MAKLKPVDSWDPTRIGNATEQQLRERMAQTRLDWADQIEVKDQAIHTAMAAGQNMRQAWGKNERAEYAHNLAQLAVEQRRLMVEISKRVQAEREQRQLQAELSKQMREQQKLDQQKFNEDKRAFADAVDRRSRAVATAGQNAGLSGLMSFLQGRFLVPPLPSASNTAVKPSPPVTAQASSGRSPPPPVTGSGSGSGSGSGGGGGGGGGKGGSGINPQLLKAGGAMAAVTAGLAIGWEAMRGAINAAVSGLESVGEAAKAVAQNDGFGALTHAVDLGAKAVEKIPLIGGLLGDALRAPITALNVFKSVIDSFAARGRELSRYNSGIAAAVAETQVEKILADIREANKNQKEYIETIRASARLDREWQRALEDLKRTVMPVLVRLASSVSTVISAFGGALDKNNAGVDKLIDRLEALKLFLGDKNGKFQKAIDHLKQIADNTAPEADPKKVLNALKDFARKGIEVNDKAVPDKVQNPLPPPLRFKP